MGRASYLSLFACTVVCDDEGVCIAQALRNLNLHLIFRDVAQCHGWDVLGGVWCLDGAADLRVVSVEGEEV